MKCVPYPHFIEFVSLGCLGGVPAQLGRGLLRRQAVDVGDGDGLAPPAHLELEHQLLRLLSHVHRLQVP